MGQQAIKQVGIAARLEAQVHICHFAGGGFPGINHHHATPLTLRRLDTLVENRMIPGRIAPDQYHQIRQFKIVVAGRHNIGAKRTLVSSNG